MTPARAHPLLLEINARPWLAKLGVTAGHSLTLGDVPDQVLDDIAAQGFDWVWLMGVWETGPLSREVSRSVPSLRVEYARTLPDLCEDDIAGSGYAVSAYRVRESLGGDQALSVFRTKLHARGVRLLLDFVPNHVGLDHTWVHTHPEYFIHATEEDLATHPQRYRRMDTAAGPAILAYGRDPHYEGWADTLQLNFENPTLQQALVDEMLHISSLSDGVRCDMAMLVLPDVFQRTWGSTPQPFWPTATASVRAQHPDFMFLAEVYSGYEAILLDQGFDYCYDKPFYDTLRDKNVYSVREHLERTAARVHQGAHFLENHDEERATHTFSLEQHFAAAVLCFFAPGLRFFQDGQCTGELVHLSPHLCRAPVSTPNEEIRAFYATLLKALSLPVVHEGQWQLLSGTAPDGSGGIDGRCIAYLWQRLPSDYLLVIVNYTSETVETTLRAPGHTVVDAPWVARDLFGKDTATFQPGEQGAHTTLTLEPWGVRVFTGS